MITFIGLGLWDEKSMSLEAIEEAKGCDKLYAEFYTSKLFGTTAKKLEEIFGKPIEVLPREEVESGKNILEDAKGKKVGFLVAGDAMTATTHVDILLEAKKLGIETKIVHGSSIYTAAAGLAGLQIYKFGRATSLTFPQEGFLPDSPYNVISENLRGGMHTLVFLDIQPPKYMTANEGMQVLLDIEKKRKEDIFSQDTKIAVVARAGSDKPLVKFGKVKDLLQLDFGEPLHVMIVPGRLHFKEEEALQQWK
jgi:diphthine synthase